MARKTNRDRWSYSVALAPRPGEGKLSNTDRVRSIGGSEWKSQALAATKTRLSIQIKKALLRGQGEWYEFHCVSRYGAPGRGEFICPHSGMVAAAPSKCDYHFFRSYWGKCATKSAELLEMLESIDSSQYSVELHRYISSLIIFTYGQREVLDVREGM